MKPSGDGGNKDRAMKRRMAVLGVVLALGAARMAAQETYPLHPDPMDGIWQGYDAEWRHVSNQLVALAEATPAEKFAWRPAPGVRSTSEVYMHIAMANFYLLSVTGPPMPPDLKGDAEKTVTSKAEAIAWLKRSLEAVKRAHAAEAATDLARAVKAGGGIRRWTRCICASSFTPTSIWGNWWRTRA
jgi:hypothetical protein